MTLFAAIKTLISPPPPDPKRFAVASAPFNWNGEAVTKGEKKTGAILVNQQTNTYEFGRLSVDIDPRLTDLDIKGLRDRNLDPTNPAYAKAKEYFSKMPFCSKEDLAANSGGILPDGTPFEGIKPNTAKDVLGAFRAFLVDKPTF